MMLKFRRLPTLQKTSCKINNVKDNFLVFWQRNFKRRYMAILEIHFTPYFRFIVVQLKTYTRKHLLMNHFEDNFREEMIDKTN